MKPYIIKRILSAIPLLVIISFVCFVFINLIPSDPAEVALRVRQVPIITEEAIAEVRAELGLDQLDVLLITDFDSGKLSGQQIEAVWEWVRKSAM